jgi:hypothetical protein
VTAADEGPLPFNPVLPPILQTPSSPADFAITAITTSRAEGDARRPTSRSQLAPRPTQGRTDYRVNQEVGPDDITTLPHEIRRNSLSKLTGPTSSNRNSPYRTAPTVRRQPTCRGTVSS